MNERLQRLKRLFEIKQEATQSAYQALIHAKEQFNRSKLRHEQLAGYRQDYMQQMERLGQEGSSVGRLRHRIDFITHLDMALVQLSHHLAQLAKIRSQLEAQYQEAKTAEAGLARLIERVNKVEALRLQRVEQKESDESAQKQWYIKKSHDQANTFSK